MNTPADTKPYDPQTYYALTLDPVHVGTGGYRLGRVDNSIVREPGTNLPKIPGSSLSGVCRANAAMATERYYWTNGNGHEGSCAGQGQEDTKKNKAGHCGSPNCPVCVTFGFARGNSGGFQGLAQFSDARILFFPVHSMIGPVWVTCPAVLAEHDIKESTSHSDKIKLANGLSVSDNRLNLGWLMLQSEGEFTLPDKLTDLPEEIRKRAVLVSDKLFSRIVNDNLEVRTSVSINPETGAAEDGALFTYEAIPRAAVLWFNVTYGEPKFFRIKTEVKENGKKYERMVPPDPRAGREGVGNSESRPWKEQSMPVRKVVEKGLQLIEHLGIGGMNTRGMGRVRVLKLDAKTKESNSNDQ